jgi:SlyX protein
MERIEEQIAHLTRLVDELNEVVTDQYGRIDRLERRMAVLLAAEAERRSDASGGVILGDERPPHY